MRRIARLFIREMMQRRLPHGIIHWRYLFPHPPQLIGIHRNLWRQGQPQIPRPLRLAIELWLYLRWLFWGAWISTLRCIWHRGSEIRSREGISILQQAWRVIRLSLSTCIPASAIYQFQLYKNPHRVWEYVYSHELSAFHRWRNQQFTEQKKSIDLLQDKLLFGDQLLQHGIPAVQTLQTTKRGEKINLYSSLQKYHRVFCKPRYGHGAKNIFIAEIDGNANLHISTFEGKTISTSEVEVFLNKYSTQDDYLIQPHLENHPTLAPLVKSSDIITIRLITEYSNTPYYNAVLEIPITSSVGRIAKQQSYVILPIDLKTGKVGEIDEDRIPSKTLNCHRLAVEKTRGLILPFWQELLATGLAAHQLVPGIFAVAWDFAITPEGIFMLEGNSSWGVIMPQFLQGGLFSNGYRS